MINVLRSGEEITNLYRGDTDCSISVVQFTILSCANTIPFKKDIDILTSIVEMSSFFALFIAISPYLYNVM